MMLSEVWRKMRSAREVRRTYQNWPRWFLSRTGVHVGGASTEIRVNGCKLLAPNNAESWGIADQVWRENVYTKHFSILDGYRVLDVGAHFGFFSVFAAYQRPAVKVVSYEPSPSTYKILRKNLDRNLDKGNSFAFNFGLSEKSEERTFYKPAGHDASGTLFKENIGRTSGPVIEERVRIEAADKIWDMFEKYDFAKLDCEGAEVPILLRLGEQVKRLHYLVMEYHDDPEPIVQFLSAMNFSIVELVDQEVNSEWNAFSQLGMLYAKNDYFAA